jgi:ABC-2 type transport system ATP-binding protein
VKRVCLIALLAAAALVPAGAADVGVPGAMDDGVQLSTAVQLPAGTPPAGGWPGAIVLHGLGGNKATVAQIAQYFVAHGYAVLSYDARGHGASGGNVELAGPREVADLRTLFQRFAALPEVSDTKIGCWGISYGGGECWNGAAAGIPFGALDVVETWTNLYTALWPGNVAKSGIVLGFAKTIEARSPLIQEFENDAVHSTNMGTIRTLVAPRSALPRLGSVSTPVYMFQGRVDYAFDVTQATEAFRRLKGPHKLYVGLFGHAPSTFPAADVDYVLSQGVAWFDRFLRGTQNGVEKPGTTIALGGGKLRRAVSLPASRTVVLRPGARIPAAATTYGGGSVTVTVKRLTRYPRLVAVVFANGKVVTHGATVPKQGRVTIPLANYVQPIPKRAKITLRLGPDSGAQDIAYLGFGDSGSIALGPARINLSVLR